MEAAAAKEQQERLEALERARAEEAKLRELSFRAEESRVREGLDGFIPHKVTQVATAVKELDAEKARLNELEGKMKAGGKQRLDNLQRRDRRVAEVKASTDIQRIVRGKFGRKRAHMKRKQMEMEAAGISLLPPLHPELPGPDPRDFGPSETPESGANTPNKPHRCAARVASCGARCGRRARAGAVCLAPDARFGARRVSCGRVAKWLESAYVAK